MPGTHFLRNAEAQGGMAGSKGVPLWAQVGEAHTVRLGRGQGLPLMLCFVPNSQQCPVPEYPCPPSPHSRLGSELHPLGYKGIN